VSREKRAADAARGALEVDLKAVLARHAREVEAAATARREASREKAARAAADAELARLSNQVGRLPASAPDAAHAHALAFCIPYSWDIAAVACTPPCSRKCGLTWADQ
jgi:hypothetical protein